MTSSDLISRSVAFHQLVDECKEEEWRLVPGYDDQVAVSDHGRVFSFKKDKLLHQYTNGQYKCVILKKGEKGVFVHRLVAQCFLPLGTPEQTQVDHIDLNKVNNHISNLRRASQLQNNYNRRIPLGTREYTGVNKEPTGNFSASIIGHGKKTFLGVYKTAKGAALAYAKEAVRRQGEFVREDVKKLLHESKEEEHEEPVHKHHTKYGRCVYRLPSGAFSVKIKVKGKQHYLGAFAELTEAREAIAAFAKKRAMEQNDDGGRMKRVKTQ